MKISKEMAAYLKKKRIEAGLTQKDVAMHMKYSSPQFVSNWERAMIMPPAETMAALMRLYKVPEKEFLQALVAESERFWSVAIGATKKKKSS